MSKRWWPDGRDNESIDLTLEDDETLLLWTLPPPVSTRQIILDDTAAVTIDISEDTVKSTPALVSSPTSTQNTSPPLISETTCLNAPIDLTLKSTHKTAPSLNSTPILAEKEPNLTLRSSPTFLIKDSTSCLKLTSTPLVRDNMSSLHLPPILLIEKSKPIMKSSPTEDIYLIEDTTLPPHSTPTFLIEDSMPPSNLLPTLAKAETKLTVKSSPTYPIKGTTSAPNSTPTVLIEDSLPPLNSSLTLAKKESKLTLKSSPTFSIKDTTPLPQSNQTFSKEDTTLFLKPLPAFSTQLSTSTFKSPITFSSEENSMYQPTEEKSSNFSLPPTKPTELNSNSIPIVSIAEPIPFPKLSSTMPPELNFESSGETSHSLKSSISHKKLSLESIERLKCNLIADINKKMSGTDSNDISTSPLIKNNLEKVDDPVKTNDLLSKVNFLLTDYRRAREGYRRASKALNINQREATKQKNDIEIPNDSSKTNKHIHFKKNNGFLVKNVQSMIIDDKDSESNRLKQENKNPINIRRTKSKTKKNPVKSKTKITKNDFRKNTGFECNEMQTISYETNEINNKNLRDKNNELYLKIISNELLKIGTEITQTDTEINDVNTKKTHDEIYIIENEQSKKNEKNAMEVFFCNTQKTSKLNIVKELHNKQNKSLKIERNRLDINRSSIISNKKQSKCNKKEKISKKKQLNKLDCMKKISNVFDGYGTMITPLVNLTENNVPDSILSPVNSSNEIVNDHATESEIGLSSEKCVIFSKDRQEELKEAPHKPVPIHNKNQKKMQPKDPQRKKTKPRTAKQQIIPIPPSFMSFHNSVTSSITGSNNSCLTEYVPSILNNCLNAETIEKYSKAGNKESVTKDITRINSNLFDKPEHVGKEFVNSNNRMEAEAHLNNASVDTLLRLKDTISERLRTAGAHQYYNLTINEKKVVEANIKFYEAYLASLARHINEMQQHYTNKFIPSIITERSKMSEDPGVMSNTTYFNSATPYQGQDLMTNHVNPPSNKSYQLQETAPKMGPKGKSVTKKSAQPKKPKLPKSLRLRKSKNCQFEFNQEYTFNKSDHVPQSTYAPIVIGNTVLSHNSAAASTSPPIRPDLQTNFCSPPTYQVSRNRSNFQIEPQKPRQQVIPSKKKSQLQLIEMRPPFYIGRNLKRTPLDSDNSFQKASGHVHHYGPGSTPQRNHEDATRPPGLCDVLPEITVTAVANSRANLKRPLPFENCVDYAAAASQNSQNRTASRCDSKKMKNNSSTSTPSLGYDGETTRLLDLIDTLINSK